MRDDLYADPVLAQFYDRDRPRPDFEYCQNLARSAGRVLDLGCGTGQLAAALAGTRHVVGVDPAAAMLDIARARPGGGRVCWVQADARNVRLHRQFDLVVLTGHSFQVLLSDADQSAVLTTIREHLAPNGRFVFDSRNPDFAGRKERDRSDKLSGFTHPVLGIIEPWNISRYNEDTGILHYTNGYREKATGAEHSASARIRYSRRDDLAARIDAVGLFVREWLEDWTGAAFSTRSPEIIPIGQRAAGTQETS